jgi:hypothetical protein
MSEAVADSNLSEDDLKATILIESGGDPSVENQFGFKGLLQLGDARAKELGVIDPFNPKESIQGYMRHAKQAETALVRHDLEATPLNIYIMWQQGLTGGRRILQNPEAKVDGFRYERNVTNNPPPDSTYKSLSDPTVGDWIEGWGRVFLKKKTASLDTTRIFG